MRIRRIFAGIPFVISVFVYRLAAQIDWPDLSTTEIATGATLPVHMTHSGDGSGRLFVVEQPGRILVATTNGFAAKPFLDIQQRVHFEFGGEDGLLNLAFPRDFATTQKFYVYYTRTGDFASVVSRFSVSTNANEADVTSEQQVLVIPEVTPDTLNGGMLGFGPDGFLYISTGDNVLGVVGGLSEAQKTSSLWGKILRIDVSNSPTGYRIPSDNPFTGRFGYAPEIWALGLRNPFRFCFDRANGDLYVSDVGQFIAEEIDFEPAPSRGGRNYGWQTREGRHDFFAPPGSAGEFVEPIYEAIHAQPITIPQVLTGGCVYRGASKPRMDGMYFFGDAFSGLIQGLVRSNGIWQAMPLLKTPFFLSSFGEDESGNLYMTDYFSGGLFRLSDTQRAKAPNFSPPGPVSDTDVMTITSLTTGATIRVTTDGTDPTPASVGIQSGGAVIITAGTTLKARSFRNDLQPSEVTAMTFTLKASKPTFTPNQGISPTNTIQISAATPNAAIRYTLDGSDPTLASPVYSSPVRVGADQNLKARAFRTGFNESEVSVFFSTPLRLEPFQRDSFGRAVISWTSIAGQIYRLQTSPDLSYWIDVSSNLTATTTLMSFTNISYSVQPWRSFFRVVAE